MHAAQPSRDWLRTGRNLGNVANLSTPLGLILAAVGRGSLRRRRHLIIADRVRLPLVDASAMTVGCVVLVLGRTLEEALAKNPTLLTHEEEHAWQWAACAGLPFLPLYYAAAGWSILRTGDRASANLFEVQAGLRLGGYEPREKLPLRVGLSRLLNRARGAGQAQR